MFFYIFVIILFMSFFCLILTVMANMLFDELTGFCFKLCMDSVCVNMSELMSMSMNFMCLITCMNKNVKWKKVLFMNSRLKLNSSLLKESWFYDIFF